VTEGCEIYITMRHVVRHCKESTDVRKVYKSNIIPISLTANTCMEGIKNRSR